LKLISQLTIINGPKNLITGDKMKNNTINLNKIYGIMGKSLCAVAGGIVGLIVSGPFLVIPGTIGGFMTGHILEKGVATNS